MVDFDTFAKSDFRAVKILACEAVKKSKKLLKFTLDDGERKDGEVLQTLAQELAEETACRMLRHCGVRRCRLYMIYRLRCRMPPGR